VPDDDPTELDPALRARLEAAGEVDDDPDENLGEARRIALILLTGVLVAAGIVWIMYLLGELFKALLA